MHYVPTYNIQYLPTAPAVINFQLVHRLQLLYIDLDMKVIVCPVKVLHNGQDYL